jgi:LysM repeat protein
MKSFFIKTLPIFLLFISLLSWGQQDNFPVKKINGTDYYVYTVQQGEGLYSISKRFGVSQAEINNLNPQIHEGLKAGQEIVIPVNEKNVKNTITSSQSPKSDKEKSVSKKETEIVKHVVLKKQTLFAISRIYNISIDDIKKYNPEVENGLKEGMILSIPIDDTTKAETEKINKQSATNEKEIKQYYNRKTKDTIIYIEHTVKEKETLYSISKLYNTDIQSIIDLNPKSDDKLKVGAKLKILSPTTPKTTQNEKPLVSPKAEADDVKLNTRIFESVQPNKTPYKIAFLLPFMVGNSKADASIDKFIEFYSGALIAIQEAKEHGISFEISTFDTEKSEEKIQEVLQNPELINMDLIIGPAYTNQIPYVSDFSKENKINTLIPFSSKVYDVNVNPYLLQFNPGIAVEVKFIAEMLNNEYRNDNIIFCDVPSVSILDDGYEFAFELQNGETFEDAINDLNVINIDEQKYDVLITFKDGKTLARESVSINMFSSKPQKFWVENMEEDESLYVEFSPNNVVYDYTKCLSSIESKYLKLSQNKKYKNTNVESAIFKRTIMNNYNYAI